MGPENETLLKVALIWIGAWIPTALWVVWEFARRVDVPLSYAGLAP